MILPSPRLTNFGLFVLMLVGMGVALYLQHYAHLEPCPLCVFQRVSLMSMGIVALMLQHLPADEVPSCGPGLDYWMDTFPFQEVVQKVLRGSGECAKVDWMMFGLSLPEWTLMMFVGLTSVVVWQLVRKA